MNASVNGWKDSENKVKGYILFISELFLKLLQLFSLDTDPWKETDFKIQKTPNFLLTYIDLN